MNPAQPVIPNSEEAHFRAVEQACADSLAVQENTQRQIDTLLKGFQHLEKLMQANIPTHPQIHSTNPTPIQAIPTGRPPPLALPSEYDGNCSQGQSFLTSCQTYIHLCPDLFLSKHIKIMWAMSYMKSGRVAKWAERVFEWEERHEGYSKFLDWEEFRKEFWKDFCPPHSNVVAINKLESMGYYQKSWPVDDYLDEFVELVVEAGIQTRKRP